MSWLFSRALVAEYSEENCSDGTLSAQLNGPATPQAFCAQGKTMAFSGVSRYGMTFGPLTDDHGEALLMWFLEASRAKTSALREPEQELKVNEVVYGQSLLGSLAKFDPDSCSWKTAQLSLLEGLDGFSETWPRWGSMQDGVCWELPTLVRRTNESESGLWQTPVADDCVNRVAGKWNSRGEPKLSAQVLNWPTPTVSGNHNRKGASPTSGDGLSTVVKMRTANGGTLNPTWVEWLMGWPLGWTDLKPLVTDKYRSAPLRPGDS